MLAVILILMYAVGLYIHFVGVELYKKGTISRDNVYWGMAESEPSFPMLVIIWPVMVVILLVCLPFVGLWWVARKTVEILHSATK